MTTPYYQDEHVTLHLGDWREKIESEFVADLIVTDPPYGETSLAWDRWPDGWPTLAARHARSMWCFGSMRMFLNRRDDFTDWKLSQDIIWSKPHATSLDTSRFRRRHEVATHWYQGAWSEVHHTLPRVLSGRTTPQNRATPGKSAGRAGERVYNYGLSGGWTDDGTRLMSSVIEVGHGVANKDRKALVINATQKPLGIIDPLISYGCPPGGTVLDLFSGSGSTLVAARNLGRKAVGYEIREEQAELTAQRLSQGVLDFGGVS